MGKFKKFLIVEVSTSEYDADILERTNVEDAIKARFEGTAVTVESITVTSASDARFRAGYRHAISTIAEG